MFSVFHLSRLELLRHQSFFLKNSTKINNNLLKKYQQCCKVQNKHYCDCSYNELNHFIELKETKEDVIHSIIRSALYLKSHYPDTHREKTNILSKTKVMLLEDHREPVERMALSKAVSLLGAEEVHITSQIDWDHYYYSKIFSEMADVIFVSAEVFGCLRKFAKHSLVPVVVMRSRLHSTVQSMATIMSMLEDYGDISGLNVAYVGWPHQVINDYLFLCPLNHANFYFKCCCNVCPVSPFMLNEGTATGSKSQTTVKQYTDTMKTITEANVIISGPPSKKKEKIPEFTLHLQDIEKNTKNQWTFYHTLPRGLEIDDELFWHENSRTFNAIKNMQYICAALILNSV